jgi:lysophospholipase L1-like esterase
MSVVGVVVPFVEIHLARRGLKLSSGDLLLDGPVGHDGSDEATDIVWLGDSTAAGVGASEPDGALPRQVAAHLTRPVSLQVFARSGAKVADVVADQLPRLAGLRHAPELIIISVGANDVAGRTRRRRFIADYTTMLDAAAASGAHVVVLGIPDMSSAMLLAQPLRVIAGARARVVDRWIRSAAALHADHVTYVDLTAYERVPRKHVANYLSADRYHPNAVGYQVWANLVAERVNDVFAAG